MTHPLLATCSVEGPRDLTHLAQLLHEAGCSAAAWLVEAAAERLPELEAECEDYKCEKLPEAREEAFEEGKAEGKQDAWDDSGIEDVVNDLDALVTGPGRVTKAEVKAIADRLGDIIYPKEEKKAA